jgi:hypothetical protein
MENVSDGILSLHVLHSGVTASDFGAIDPGLNPGRELGSSKIFCNVLFLTLKTKFVNALKENICSFKNVHLKNELK